MTTIRAFWGACAAIVAAMLVMPSPCFAGEGELVTLETARGDIVLCVDTEAAPISSADFLRYVDLGLYDGASFYRVVREDNDNGSPPIEVVQGGLTDFSKALDPVAHETTETSGLRHVDGAIALARGAPGTGSAANFYVSIGANPALDFGGTRNADGQGFAVFGRVVEGMDILRVIHRDTSGAPTTQPYMRGQILDEPVRIVAAYRGKPHSE